MARLRCTLAVFALLLVAAPLPEWSLVSAQEATPGPNAITMVELAPGVQAEVLAGVPSARATGQTVYLARFTFAPGAEIFPHRHPGTTVLAVVSGTFGWTLLAGSAQVVRESAAGGAGAAEVLIAPGVEVLLQPGDAIFYEDDVVHTARGAGDAPTVVLATQVLTSGAPRLMPVDMAMGGTPPASSASAVSTAETLFDVTLDALPTGHAIVDVDRWTLQPGSSALVLPPYGGPTVIMVDAGEITATEAGITTPLSAGEHLIPASDQGIALQITGYEEAVLFVAYLFPGFSDLPQEDYRFREKDPMAHRFAFLISSSVDALPGGPGRFVLERLTLPAGTTLPAQEASRLVWMAVGDGAIGLTLQGEQLPFRWKPGTERTYRPGQYLPSLADGTQMTLRSAAAEPLVLYRLTLTPQAAEMPVGTPPVATPTA